MQQPDFAERLRKAMRAAGLNQAKLAAKVGVSQPTVHGWLNGADISYSNYCKVTAVLPAVEAAA